MGSQKVLIPAQAGIQVSRNQFKRLDSRFHGNDGIGLLTTFCESFILPYASFSAHHSSFIVHHSSCLFQPEGNGDLDPHIDDLAVFLARYELPFFDPF